MELDSIRCSIKGMVEHCSDQANQIFPSLMMPQPIVGWFTKTKTAGYAHYAAHKVTFNEVIARDNFEKFENTVIHEVAHLVTNRLFPNAKPHGREWKYVMRKLGAIPSRCHRYNVASIKETRVPTKKYIYTCMCSEGKKEHLIGGQRHNNIVAGRKVFTCNACRERIRYSGKVRTWKKA